MGKGLAQVVTFGSIALTVLSLVIAVLTARSRSRIRPAFDVTRAVVGVGAIVIMAAISGVTTPVFLVGLAIVVGTALGFAQGAHLLVVPGQGGLFARRSPVALALWGAGIVVMQAAGIAVRCCAPSPHGGATCSPRSPTRPRGLTANGSLATSIGS